VSKPGAARAAARRELWRRRDAQSPAQRRAAGGLILAALARSPWLKPGSAVALYVSRGSEVDSRPLRALALHRGCRVYLPRITDYRGHRMIMVREAGGALRRNRYRIAEPAGSAAVAAPALAVVLMPLVGFDDEGNRLGNGAGYYDRFFSARRGARGAPLLVGIGFECQRCPPLEAAAHDVPLDAIITERGIQTFAGKS
jgi:5-formyltetrahydrofolate cyclo-ligase